MGLDSQEAIHTFPSLCVVLQIPRSVLSANVDIVRGILGLEASQGSSRRGHARWKFCILPAFTVVFNGTKGAVRVLIDDSYCSIATGEGKAALGVHLHVYLQIFLLPGLFFLFLLLLLLLFFVFVFSSQCLGETFEHVRFVNGKESLDSTQTYDRLR
jgi:hypothetical protein